MKIDKYQDVIDSREVIKRIEELRDEATAAVEGIELAALEALAKEASGSPGWAHGEILIRDSYFTAYAQELAEDMCPYPFRSAERDVLESWPYRHIDWEAAARELKYDYFSVEFDGVTYWVRS